MSIQCPFCDKTFSSLKVMASGHLMRVHGINSKTYYDTFLYKKDEDKCVICGNTTPFISLKKGYNNVCCGACKFKTKEYRYNLKKGINNSTKFKEAKQKDEYKNKHRENKLKLYENNPEIKEQISNSLKEYHKNDPNAFEKASNAITTAIAEGKLRTRYFYDNTNFDSSWEIIFYIAMKLNNKDIKRCDFKIPYSYIDNITRNYVPDFIINGELYEIKGLHFFENMNPNGKMICPFNRNQRTAEENSFIDGLYEAKHQCMIKNNVKIITNIDEYKTLLLEHNIDISIYKIIKNKISE